MASLRTAAPALPRRRVHDPTPLRHLLALAVRRRFAGATPRALLAELHETPAFSEGELASIQVPIHLFWGRGERLLRRSHLEYFRTRETWLTRNPR